MKRCFINLSKKENAGLTLFLAATLLLAALSQIYIYCIGNKVERPIRSDGVGYYSYLPAVFDYQDLTFQFAPYDYNWGVWRDAQGHYINKYPVGTAIMELPFFLVADIGCKLFYREAATGYTWPYHIAVVVSATFYFLWGLLLLYKVLREWFSHKVTMISLVAITYATNLFHWATFDACFSHIYSFFLITAFVRITQRLERTKRIKAWSAALGLSAGMAAVARNPDVIIILFYVLYTGGGGDNPSRQG